MAGGGAAILASLPANLIPPGSHGFRITIRVVTPYGGDPVLALGFVSSTFVKNLMDLRDQENKAGKTYTIMWADVTSRLPAINDPEYSRILQAQILSWQTETGALAPPAPGAAMVPGAANPFGMAQPPQPVNMFGAGNPGGLPAAAIAANGYIDPRTDEDMKDDSLLEVTALAVITPPGTPYPALPAAAPGAAPAPH
jgi:hypothetical protein